MTTRKRVAGRRKTGKGGARGGEQSGALEVLILVAASYRMGVRGRATG